MAFDNGVFSAPELNPNNSGLFSIIKPETYSATANQERWVRGYAQEFIAEPTAISNYDDTDTINAPVYVATSKPERYIDIKPFFVEVEDTDSTLGLVYEDRFKRVTDQLEAATQKAVERELHDGQISAPLGLGNTVLANGPLMPASDTAMSAERALAILEHSARSNSPTGEQPYIHMSADVASLLKTAIQFDKKEDMLVTRLGSPVIIGAGYTGNGPLTSLSTYSITSNTLTVNTATAHGLTTGDTAYLNFTGASLSARFSNYVTVTVSDSTTFTVSFTNADITEEAAVGVVQFAGSVDTKWIYASGCLDINLGAVEVVNDTLAQGYDVSGNQNDMRIKAFRSASVHFDTSIHLAVKVDLTA